jgi:hypothetical protein
MRAINDGELSPSKVSKELLRDQYIVFEVLKNSGYICNNLVMDPEKFCALCLEYAFRKEKDDKKVVLTSVKNEEF